MRKSALFIFVLSAIICTAWVKKEPVRPERFVGKWFIVDYTINGTTDPDCVAEIDSTTYILRADGTFTFCRCWYQRCLDTTTVCGNWQYLEKKNHVRFDWTSTAGKRQETWRIKTSDATTMLTGAGNVEVHWRKAQ